MMRPFITTIAIAALLCGCPDSDTPAAPDAGLPDLPDIEEVDPDLGLVDDLSMPATPTLNPANFNLSTECARCHPRHVAEWRTSMHAYAMVDPVYQALVKVRQADYQGTEDRFCLQCHSAIGTRGGEVVPGFEFSDLSRITMEGVTCEACHRISEVTRLHNSGHVLDESGPLRGPIEDPVPNNFHESAFSPLFGSAEICGSCHDVIETDGLNLERPYAEWLESPAAANDQPCQSCHMPTYTGRAALEGPEREGLHDHHFIGVDIPLTEGFASEAVLDDLKARIEALLQSSASLKIEAASSVQPGDQLDLFVTITNQIAGHNLPTGSTFIRQLWLEVTVTDGEGRILYQTGHLDDMGDLRDHFSGLDPYGDPDLIKLGSGFVDAEGFPEIFPWRAAEHTSTALSPLYDRTYTLFIPTDADTTGPIQIESRLRFRSLPPFLLRALDLPELVERVPIYEIDSDALEVEVGLP